ncbi:glycosyltransferase family 4 protein [Paenibacillus lactis]|uniref:glycosyltransferase family 4 protein n=1 Tax=Paenibacillus lactis TaxID=228574 RepID=UPI0036BB33DD
MISKLRQREFTARNHRLFLAQPQKVAPLQQKIEKLKVVYVMTHVSVCGGVKVILEHANQLVSHGWDVCIVSHFPKPDWYPINADYKQVSFGVELAQGIPLCDIIVATYWDHIQSCIETGIAPVVYFEQGDEHLFHIERLSDDVQSFVKTQMKLPAFIMTVSQMASHSLKNTFNRDSVIIPNAIDHHVFSSSCMQNGSISTPKEQYILMMGNENISFKGIPKIINVFQRIKHSYPELKLYWINPKPPEDPWKHKADQVFVNPPQSKIAELFRNAKMFVSASEFESFSLPVIEAMATGCPVVSTRNEGVKEYGIHGNNILLAEIGNEEDLYAKVMTLLEDGEQCRKLSENGMETAKKYTWENSAQILMDYLRYVSAHAIEGVNQISDWNITIDESLFLNVEDRIKFNKALYHVKDDIVYIPIIHNWIENHPIARWEIAATRRVSTNTSSIRVLAPASVPLDVNLTGSVVLGEGIQLVIEKQYSEALEYFIRQYNHSSEEWKPVCSKWIILCLIELERDHDALKVIQDTVCIYEGFSDALYLYYLLLCIHKSESKAEAIVDTIQLIGDSMNEMEWFLDLPNQIRH